MEKIIDGKMVAKKIRTDLKIEVDELKAKGIFPKLAVIMVGDDPSSKIYVRNKNKACEEVGIEYEEHILDAEIEMEELLKTIETLNNREYIHGILLQSPIPKHLNAEEAFRAISPAKDVDGFHPVNVGKLSLGQDTFISCTPFGVMKILEEYDVELEGKNAVIIGRSNIVGKPMLQCLLEKNATVTVCHSRTKDLAKIASGADILVAAIGRANFVTADMVKENAVVIDVGINRMEDGKICGDVDYEAVLDKVKLITPVPGGVGPMTVAMLMHNVVKACR